VAIGGDLQVDILDFLAEKIGPGAGLREAEAASHLQLQLCRPESLRTEWTLRKEGGEATVNERPEEQVLLVAPASCVQSAWG
jgi:hypothetical protein